MRHVCVTQGPHWPALHDVIFPQGGGKEGSPPDGGGFAGGDRDGSHSIRDPPRPDYLLQIPWENPIGVGQHMARGGTIFLTGTTELRAAVQGVEQVGRRCPYPG